MSTLYKTIYNSGIESLGELSIVSDGESITGVWFVGQKYFEASLSEEPVFNEGLPIFAMTKDWLDRYFAGDKPLAAELPVSLCGSDFRRMIWRLLCEIPYGETVTYAKLAEKAAMLLGRRSMSAQAVGGAIAHNPISIIIPCHRVIGSDGSLTGYAGGIEKKKILLEHEKALS